MRNYESKTRPGKKVLNEPAAFEGKVIEMKGCRCNIQYENNVGNHLTDWFNVKDIASLTREEKSCNRTLTFGTAKKPQENVSKMQKGDKQVLENMEAQEDDQVSRCLAF